MSNAAVCTMATELYLYNTCSILVGYLGKSPTSHLQVDYCQLGCTYTWSARSGLQVLQGGYECLPRGVMMFLELQGASLGG
eukprot:1143903-Pelagomonas_calceolata.AAC.3